MKNIAIIIGHNEKHQGAVAFNGKTEFEVCSEAAEKIAMESADSSTYNVTVYWRPSGTSYTGQCRYIAQAVKEDKIDVALCLHFNSGGGNGCECLFADNGISDDFEKELCGKICSKLKNIFGFKIRHENGIVPCKLDHNGYLMMNSINEKGVPCVLVEPCFGDNETDKTRRFFENIGEYAECISSVLGDILG